MKFPVAVILLALVVMIQGQCPGQPTSQLCLQPRNDGRGGRRCRPRTMWYYNQATRTCLQMRYRGCGGNNNRWCTQAQCLNGCI